MSGSNGEQIPGPLGADAEDEGVVIGLIVPTGFKS